jgi:Cys-rich protein (TIGR01571 family)
MASWKTGLCSCVAYPGGVEACCLGFCCTGVLYGLNVEKLSRPHECTLGGSCVGAAAVWNGLAYSSLCFIAQCVARGAIRKKYSIPGNMVVDCLVSACCCYCSVIQASMRIVYDSISWALFALPFPIKSMLNHVIGVRSTINFIPTCLLLASPQLGTTWANPWKSSPLRTTWMQRSNNNRIESSFNEK